MKQAHPKKKKVITQDGTVIHDGVGRPASTVDPYADNDTSSAAIKAARRILDGWPG